LAPKREARCHRGKKELDRVITGPHKEGKASRNLVGPDLKKEEPRTEVPRKIIDGCLEITGGGLKKMVMNRPRILYLRDERYDQGKPAAVRKKKSLGGKGDPSECRKKSPRVSQGYSGLG